MMRVGHMCHQLRVTEPTIGDHQRCGEGETASAQGRQGLIEHDLRPPQFDATPPPRPGGVGPTHRKVNGHDQLAVANDHQEEHAINAIYHALVLATPPRADELQLVAIFPKHGVIKHPRPLPATAGGVTPRLDVAPK
jgi:hypothetical protein